MYHHRLYTMYSLWYFQVQVQVHLNSGHTQHWLVLLSVSAGGGVWYAWGMGVFQCVLVAVGLHVCEVTLRAHICVYI